MEGAGRRVFLGMIGTAGAGWAVAEWRGAHRPAEAPVYVEIAEFDRDGKRLGTRRMQKIVKSEEEWKRQLAPDEFWMTRRGDTELAFAGAYWNSHEDGLYGCVCCGTALFDSRDKFNSGTGWPSFTKPMAKENVRTNEDRSFGMSRTAVGCALCDGHLGHVFEGGPPPGGLRYCINSASLRFRERDLT